MPKNKPKKPVKKAYYWLLRKNNSKMNIYSCKSELNTSILSMLTR
ncbi:hypothetical protein DFP93_10548 [Aneurinibacillus soli]|uniref:Uncharacterized protein n=1 Tax=Aneurinibacillus soli TaxID=1500254 RepID=A0A0U5BCP5_9BACL|nr:hypothetical protein DFP93_10548 [Aneurinibacillus soli]BAU28716.1 hypothetical protein CB4_02891 [Aneurinibacillus soli]